jgi:hypothetical protein
MQKKLKNVQVRAAAALHRKPGLQQILDSIRLYRKDCAAGFVRVSPTGTPSKLHAFSGSSEMMKKFPACNPAGQVFEKQRRGKD